MYILSCQITNGMLLVITFIICLINIMFLLKEFVLVIPDSTEYVCNSVTI